jgi:predicted GIY-YIG superfamily endonuclease
MKLSLDSALRQYRTEQAYIRAVPPAAVFGNALLKRIVLSKPCSLVALSKLHGIGQTRSLHYGKDIVRLVNLQTRNLLARRSLRVNNKNTKSQNKKALATSTAKGAKKRQRKAGKGKPQAKNIKRVKPVKKATSIAPIPAQPLNKFNNYTPVVVSRFFAEKTFEKSLLPNVPIEKIEKEDKKPSVYILELEHGRVYVGSSKDVPRRIAQHSRGYGSAYTKAYKPTGILLPRLGNIEGDGDAAERDETLRYMMLKGVAFVRGWKFARVDMPPEECEEAEANIRELFDLCRRCGYKGHFCTHCRATFDRLGKAIVK